MRDGRVAGRARPAATHRGAGRSTDRPGGGSGTPRSRPRADEGRQSPGGTGSRPSRGHRSRRGRWTSGGVPQPGWLRTREANIDTAFAEELSVRFERSSSKRPGESGDEPQGYGNQRDREEVCGRLPNPDASSQGREEPVVQEERDAEHDGGSENVRLARGVHGPPAQREHHLVFRRQAPTANPNDECDLRSFGRGPHPWPDPRRRPDGDHPGFPASGSYPRDPRRRRVYRKTGSRGPL